jgi:MFS family permease
MSALRRLRGIAVTAVLWGAAFALVGAVFGLGLALAIAAGALPPQPDAPENFYLLLVGSRIARWAVIGALSGTLFAATLMVAERRQTLESLSAERFARWGLLAGALGSAAMAAIVAAFILLDGTAAASAWRLMSGFAAVPVVGALFGRATAAATLHAARSDLLVPGARVDAGARVLRDRVS